MFSLEVSTQMKLDKELSLMEKLVGQVPGKGTLEQFGEPVSKGIIFGMAAKECSLEHIEYDTEFRAGIVYLNENGKVVAVSRPRTLRYTLLNVPLGYHLHWVKRVIRDDNSPFTGLRMWLLWFIAGIPVGLLLILFNRLTRKRLRPAEM